MNNIWLIGGAIVLSALGVTVYTLNKEEEKSRQRWHKKRKEVKLTIEQHRQRIARHIEEATTTYNFHFLVNLHYSFVVCGNESYKFFNDARTTLKGLNKILYDTKIYKSELKNKLNQAKKENNYQLLKNIYKEIKLLNELRNQLFLERDQIKKQQEELLREVHRLNHQTHKLKILIKERCGEKGRQWYERLQKRIQQRKTS